MHASSTSGSPRCSRRTPPRYEQRLICEHRCRGDSSRAAIAAAAAGVRVLLSRPSGGTHSHGMVHHRNVHGDGAMMGRFRRSRRETTGLAGPRAQKTVSLALQGGGAHGAFTWGVLDAILEDGRLGVEAITGASAGAMNAVVMVEVGSRAESTGHGASWKPSGATPASAGPFPRPNADFSARCWASGATRPGWTSSL